MTPGETRAKAAKLPTRAQTFNRTNTRDQPNPPTDRTHQPRKEPTPCSLTGRHRQSWPALPPLQPLLARCSAPKHSTEPTRATNRTHPPTKRTALQTSPTEGKKIRDSSPLHNPARKVSFDGLNPQPPALRAHRLPEMLEETHATGAKLPTRAQTIQPKQPARPTAPRPITGLKILPLGIEPTTSRIRIKVPFQDARAESEYNANLLLTCLGKMPHHPPLQKSKFYCGELNSPPPALQSALSNHYAIPA